MEINRKEENGSSIKNFTPREERHQGSTRSPIRHFRKHRDKPVLDIVLGYPQSHPSAWPRP